MSAQEFYKIYQSGNSRQIYEILYSSKWHVRLECNLICFVEFYILFKSYN